jgi:hypothetical protein
MSTKASGMSKKTVSFSTGTSRPSLDSNFPANAQEYATVSAEDWVSQKRKLASQGNRATRESNLVDQHFEGAPRGFAITITEDSNWLELISFAFIIPYLSVCYLACHNSQKWWENMPHFIRGPRR